METVWSPWETSEFNVFQGHFTALVYLVCIIPTEQDSWPRGREDSEDIGTCVEV